MANASHLNLGDLVRWTMVWDRWCRPLFYDFTLRSLGPVRNELLHGEFLEIDAKAPSNLWWNMFEWWIYVKGSISGHPNFVQMAIDCWGWAWHQRLTILHYYCSCAPLGWSGIWGNVVWSLFLLVWHQHFITFLLLCSMSILCPMCSSSPVWFSQFGHRFNVPWPTIGSNDNGPR